VTLNILGLDLSSTCSGWAVLDLATRDIVDCGTIAPKHDDYAERNMRQVVRIEQIIDEFGIGDVYLEAVGTRFVGTAIALGHIHGAVRYLCERRGIAIDRDHHLLSPAALKHHATGDGNASKAAMVAAAQIKWPRAGIVLHDIADACWLADYGCDDIEAAG
jgi:Holliday junction resolvasome RuvABC endonuclease subunit